MTKWDEKYRAGYGKGGMPEPILMEAIADISPDIALDLACGRGRNAVYLAAHGWTVTALDSSQVVIDELPGSLEARCVDLESEDFRITPEAYGLICDCYYLHRPLFPRIRVGLKSGGLIVAVIPMIDDDPAVTPMNPAYLCEPGELESYFADWEIRHSREGKSKRDPAGRRVAELIACKPRKTQLRFSLPGESVFSQLNVQPD